MLQNPGFKGVFGWVFRVVGFLKKIHATVMKCNGEISPREKDEGQLGHQKLNQHRKLHVESLGIKIAFENS